MSKLRHCCETDGFCHIKAYHPCIEDFDEDLPGSCQYTDIDGMVESGGYFLFSEFKREVDQQEDHMRPGGQRLALERLSMALPKSTVWLIEGDSPNRQCSRMREMVCGVWGEWVPIDWTGLKAKHRLWKSESEARERARIEKRYPRRVGGWRSAA